MTIPVPIQESGGPCRICGNADGNPALRVPEMMFGTREEFTYFQCSRCGCLQIASIPEDMGRYYPRGYYSYDPPRTGSWGGRLKSALRRERLKSALGEESSWLGRRFAARNPPPPFVSEWILRAGVTHSTAILEAGCGNGALLMAMASEGFTDLTGVDPFVERPIRYVNGVTVMKKTLEEITGNFGFAMMHHAFEHLPDPLGTLRTLSRLLGRGKKVLLRIPIASAAWKRYGEDWVQLDAPRHFYLHTERSMEVLAKEAGFTVADIRYDSTAFQFWGSEQYRLGIPLNDPRSYSVSPAGSPFTPDRIREFEAEATVWNRKGEGDQACFILECG